MPSKPIFLHQLSSSPIWSTTTTSTHIVLSYVNVRAHSRVRALQPLFMALLDPPWLLMFFLCMFSCMVVPSFAALSDADILFKFKDSLAHTDSLNSWNRSISPCVGDEPKWVGIICFNNNIWGLQLENMGLSGIIDVDVLAGLPFLRTISLMNNNFDGPLPDFKKLVALKSIYLSRNQFSGQIPDDAFKNMMWLKKIYLSSNEFTGKIPSSLVDVPKLLVVRLDGNHFEGKIPNFQQKDLYSVNVSHNDLKGPIPHHLSKMKAELFAGNDDLCGPPLDPCGTRKKPSRATIIIAIIIIIFVILLALVLAFIILRRRRRASQLGRSASLNKSGKMLVGEAEKMKNVSTDHHSTGGKKGDHGKLMFIRDDTEKFDLQDLLRASAEVLGSGTFGSSYKAALLTGPVMVVKRYRQMNNVGREDFTEHMRRLGRLKHPNLLSLVAYYYRKEEKLLVSEFVDNGSLAYHLHGNRSLDIPGLDWPTRLKIVKGVAKGLAYLHNELPSMNLPHGHLKSSNVLLDESFEPLLTDYGLVPVINKDHAAQLMVAYKAPECAQRRPTRKTDVWSLGILILEMLTGKFPENYLTQVKGGNNADLAQWVNSVVREEWTGEVFDNEMKGTKNGEGEMLKLLKVGLECCEADVEKRWELNEAVEKIQELREKDHDDDFYSSFASEGDMHSRAVTEDSISFSLG